MSIKDLKCVACGSSMKRDGQYLVCSNSDNCDYDYKGHDEDYLILYKEAIAWIKKNSS